MIEQACKVINDNTFAADKALLQFYLIKFVAYSITYVLFLPKGRKFCSNEFCTMENLSTVAKILVI